MTTYPAHIICPSCGQVAANITVPLAKLLEELRNSDGRIDRFLLRTDDGKPGPSHHLVVCQHCHDSFRASPQLIIDHAQEPNPRP